MQSPYFDIASRRVGAVAPAFIIAELSANHNQDFTIAVKTLEAAKEAGADAIKLQTYTADSITLDADQACFKIEGSIWEGKTLHELYREAATPWEWLPRLQRVADELGLILFSSPFDPDAVAYLASMNMPAYKIASFEITDLPLIALTASQGKPIIISTGIAHPDEIEAAVAVCRRAGNNEVALLKCSSAYPTPLSEVNLRQMPVLAERFGTVVGLSDHTQGTAVPIAARAMGAAIIEKHLILDRGLGGPDAAFSLEPAEFATMTQAVREVEQAMGSRTLRLSSRSAQSRMFARSLFVVADVSAGETFGPDNVRSIRPGYGLPPKYLDAVHGQRAARDIKRGSPLEKSMIADATGHFDSPPARR